MSADYAVWSASLRVFTTKREALNYYPDYPGFERLFRVPIAELTDRTTDSAAP